MIPTTVIEWLVIGYTVYGIRLQSLIYIVLVCTCHKYLEVFQNGGTPKSSISNGCCIKKTYKSYKPSILGKSHLWKPPCKYTYNIHIYIYTYTYILVVAVHSPHTRHLPSGKRLHSYWSHGPVESSLICPSILWRFSHQLYKRLPEGITMENQHL